MPKNWNEINNCSELCEYKKRKGNESSSNNELIRHKFYKKEKKM